MPNILAVAIGEAHATVLIKFVERLLVVRADEQAARSGASIDGSGIVTISHKTGHMSADVNGADLNKISVLRGTCVASDQSHYACKQAEKYFVNFHKLLLIS